LKTLKHSRLLLLWFGPVCRSRILPKLSVPATANVFTANSLLRSLLFSRRSISVHATPSPDPSMTQFFRYPE
jgi:hypothetical protein